jgi:hypothetical protein
MELKTGLNARVLAAVTKAIAGLKPRPAVDRMTAYRLSKKYNSYAQYLLAYEPGVYGLAYVNLDNFSDPKVTIHDPSNKSAKLAGKKEMSRLKRQEERIARKEKAQAKAEAKKADKMTDKLIKLVKTPKVKKEAVDPKPTGWSADELKRIQEIQESKSLKRRDAIHAFVIEKRKASGTTNKNKALVA